MKIWRFYICITVNRQEYHDNVTAFDCLKTNEDYQKIVIVFGFWFQTAFCFKMAAILDTILNISIYWIKRTFHFNYLYDLTLKHP